MSRTSRRSGKGGGRQRRISVRGVRRDPPDVRKLSRALIALAMEQAAAEAAAQATAKDGAAPAEEPDEEERRA